MKNNMNLLKNKALKIILPTVLILLIWETAFLLTDNTYFIPSIKETLSSLVKILISRSFFRIVLTSVFRVLAGLFLGLILGITAATLCHYHEIMNVLLSPIISIMKATPVACIVVLLWISMTYTQLTVFVVMLMVVPIVWQNVLDGFRAIDKDLIEVSEIFRLDLKTKLRVLIVPTLMKYISPALVTSVGLSWKAEIAAEIMTNSNMGRLIYNYKNVTFDTASIFAWTIIIVLFSIALEKITKLLLRRLTNNAEN